MNLHGIVRGAITTVNPDIIATLRASTGSTIDDAGKRTATYTDSAARIQVQALAGKDLEHINDLNIQGVLRTVYLYGNYNGIIRADNKGGDLLIFPLVPGADDKVWMVVAVFETWPDWCKLAVWLQEDTAP